jgi:hypothetical protein
MHEGMTGILVEVVGAACSVFCRLKSNEHKPAQASLHTRAERRSVNFLDACSVLKIRVRR